MSAVGSRECPICHRSIYAGCHTQHVTSHDIAARRRAFWARVDKSGDCWLWTGASSKGYGQFMVESRLRYTHQLAYEWARGPVPSGLQLDHLCRTTMCVRPDHLEPVTARVNNLRGTGAAAKNAARTHCAWGHPFDTENTHVNARGWRHCRTCARRRDRSKDHQAVAA